MVILEFITHAKTLEFFIWLAGNKLKSFQGVQRRTVLVVNFFQFFKYIFFGLVVAIFDLVHDVEAIHDLC